MDDFEPFMIETDISVEVEKYYKILLFKNTDKNIMWFLKRKQAIEKKITEINSPEIKNNKTFIRAHF